MALLVVRNLHAGIDGKEILRGLDLTVKANEVHAIRKHQLMALMKTVGVPELVDHECRADCLGLTLRIECRIDAHFRELEGERPASGNLRGELERKGFELVTFDDVVDHANGSRLLGTHRIPREQELFRLAMQRFRQS